MATKKARSTARKAPAAKSTATASKTKSTKRKAPRARSGRGAGSAGKSLARGPRSSGPGFDVTRVEREIGGRKLVIETGRMAKQADGSVLVSYGDTMVLATAQSSKARDDIDFFPLTCEYREKAAAGGKFPGGFFKREGRPTTREILTCRIIDRSIRPLFPDGYKQEVQVLAQVFASDLENDSDIVAAIASFAAVAISSIPHDKVLGACRIGMRNDKLLINPTWSDLQAEDNRLNLMVSAHKGAIVMVEAGADQVPEGVILEALDLAHKVCIEVTEMVEELVEKAGKTKAEFVPPPRDQKLADKIAKKFGAALAKAPFDGSNKFEQAGSKKAVVNEVVEAFPAPADATDREAANHKKTVGGMCHELMDAAIREQILAGRRVDGRDGETIRPISVEVDVLPRCHGSALFTRGETQALCTATLGTSDDEQFLDGIYPEDRKRFLLHYNFPPFCVGEVKRFGFTSRREIGHGALAERSVATVIPSKDEFPYTLRITSDILESNGSSSMASVCGATLALMDAGVPLKQPVAGIAMGLVVEGKRFTVLSDILGTEDHCGDMDFKVTGTGHGINALQMDIKCEGLGREILEQAMEQARQGRLHILREMLKVIRAPREDLSPNAPRLETVKIPMDKIGVIIGPGGRNIRGMQDDFKCRVNISDDGTVQVAGTDSEKVLACLKLIKDMTAEVEVGQVYKGRVTSIKEFGAFIEILPGQEGLCHVSELSDEFIRSVTDVVRIGDEVEVKVKEIDDFGKIKLTRRQGTGERTGGRDARPRDRGDGGGDRDGGERSRGGRDRNVDRDRGERGPRPEREEREGDERPARSERGGRDRDRGGRGERRPRRDREERDGGSEGEERPASNERGDRDRDEGGGGARESEARVEISDELESPADLLGSGDGDGATASRGDRGDRSDRSRSRRPRARRRD